MNTYSFSFKIEGTNKRTGQAMSKFHTINVTTFFDKAYAKRSAKKEAKAYADVNYPGTIVTIIAEATITN